MAALSMGQRLERYTPDYLAKMDGAKLDPGRVADARKVAKLIAGNRTRYQKVANDTGVPWWWIGAIHYRESSNSFLRHLHNGDPLTSRTKHVPAGRPLKGAPPFTWEFSATDALKLKGLDKVKSWPVEVALLHAEAYNGFGYRSKAKPSPYLWAGTNRSDETGKYVADGKYSATAAEKQLGVVAIWLALEDQGYALFKTAAAAPEVVEATPAPAEQENADDPYADPLVIAQVQTKLRELGYSEVGNVDADAGGLTETAILAFRKDNGLPLQTTIDAELLVKLMTAKARNLGARTDATAKEVRAVVPEVQAASSGKFWAALASAGSLVTAAVSGVADQLGAAKDYVMPLKDFASDVPGWVWALAVAVIAFSLFMISRKAEKAGIEAYQNGERR